jgi:predicted tellurium resistance membrane protein TerC
LLPYWAGLLEPACEVMDPHKKIQYICAVALIFTSIAMVAYQVFEIQDVATGLLFYVGQAFLLAGSIFGLSYYVDKVTKKLRD